MARRNGREGADVCSPSEALRRQPNLPRRIRVHIHREVLPSFRKQRFVLPQVLSCIVPANVSFMFESSVTRKIAKCL